jgi:methylglutaconyl-CoA hydratase
MGAPAGGTSELLLVERRGPAVFLTLNRPAAANALSRALVAELTKLLGELAGEIAAGADLRALVLTGAGDKAFSAGADLKERRTWTLDDTRVFLGEINALMNAVAGFPRPVVAAVNGVAFGGGLELALAADIRIAADGAEMGLTETRLGIIPGAGGTQRLSRIAGVAVAKELILTGRRIGAARARELGIVSEVVPAAELGAAAARWAGEISAAAPLALGAAKRAIDEGLGRPLAEGLKIERDRYEEVLVTDDRNEGLAAFIEKRPPLYKGR